MRHIVELCKSSGKKFKTVPSLNEMINKDVSVDSIREVSYLDLLGREEVQLDVNSIEKFIKSKRIMITGAGGSIGSELVRQCLQYKPGSLIILDNSEANLFTIEQECLRMEKLTLVKAVLANIKDKKLMTNVFAEYRPQVVFHAAAYKHVPMQELSPWSAVATNVFGTLHLTQLSNQFNVEKFVLVSTDKAVHPVNIMGATKRLAEKIVQSSIDGRENKPINLAVRFGNVLNSSGSVVPIFRDQINNGGPVTVTHPEMSRYFMSIPEAGQLILQASAMAQQPGEVFILDMGKPVKIKDMAYDLIRLSGFEPEIEIPVIYTGLRPGEKMYEELVTREEKVNKTVHPKILIMKNSAIKQPWDDLKVDIEKLINIPLTFNSNSIKQKLQQMMPEYEPLDYSPPVPNEAMNQELFEIEKSTIKGQA